MTQVIRWRDDGIVIYDPWYERVMQVLEAIEQYQTFTGVISGGLLPKILDWITVELWDGLVAVSIPTLIWLLILKSRDRIYRGAVLSATAKVETTTSASFEGR